MAQVSGQLFEQSLRCNRILLQQGDRAAQVNGDCDQLLLEAVVKSALDCTTVGIGGEQQPSPRSAHIDRFMPQSHKLTPQPISGFGPPPTGTDVCHSLPPGRVVSHRSVGVKA